MKVCSWSKPNTFQSALRMLSADHLNIDGPPFPAKCVRKFKSALGGEVAYRGRGVCVWVYVCVCVCTLFLRKKLVVATTSKTQKMQYLVFILNSGSFFIHWREVSRFLLAMVVTKASILRDLRGRRPVFTQF